MCVRVCVLCVLCVCVIGWGITGFSLVEVVFLGERKKLVQKFCGVEFSRFNFSSFFKLDFYSREEVGKGFWTLGLKGTHSNTLCSGFVSKIPSWVFLAFLPTGTYTVIGTKLCRVWKCYEKCTHTKKVLNEVLTELCLYICLVIISLAFIF